MIIKYFYVYLQKLQKLNICGKILIYKRKQRIKHIKINIRISRDYKRTSTKSIIKYSRIWKIVIPL